MSQTTNMLFLLCYEICLQTHLCFVGCWPHVRALESLKKFLSSSLMLFSTVVSALFCSLFLLHLQMYHQTLFLRSVLTQSFSDNCFHLLWCSSCPFLSPLPLLFLSSTLLSGCSSACIVLPLAPALSAIRGPGEQTLAQILILWMGGCNRRCSHMSFTALRASGANGALMVWGFQQHSSLLSYAQTHKTSSLTLPGF